MRTHHPYDDGDKPPSLRLEVQISNAMQGKLIRHLGKLDAGADLTKVPEILEKELEPLEKISDVRISYGNDSWERKPTYLTKVHINGFELDAEVYFRRSDYILIGRNVLNQLKLCGDGRTFTLEDRDVLSS